MAVKPTHIVLNFELLIQQANKSNHQICGSLARALLPSRWWPSRWFLMAKVVGCSLVVKRQELRFCMQYFWRVLCWVILHFGIVVSLLNWEVVVVVLRELHPHRRRLRSYCCIKGRHSGGTESQLALMEGPRSSRRRTILRSSGWIILPP